MDFTLLDKVKELVDSFDHSYSLWDVEDDELKSFVYKYNSRVVQMPVSPSAEGYALLLAYVADMIIKNTERANDEGNVRLQSVRVHETATGYAEAFAEDFHMVDFKLEDINFSDAIKAEWKDKDWWQNLLDGIVFTNKCLEV